MKKGKITILASVIATMLVAGAVGLGTMAWYSDTETSEGNILSGATMNLMFDQDPASGPGSWVEDPDLPTLNMILDRTYDAIMPGWTEYETLRIHNDGDIEAKASLQFINVKDYENGFAEPETHDGGGPNGDGELGGVLELRISYDAVHPFDYVLVKGWSTLADLENTIITTSAIIPGGEDAAWMIEFRVDGVSVGNEIMTDSVVFDVVFGLTQVPPDPHTPY